YVFVLSVRRRPRSTHFPYTTLFRSSKWLDDYALYLTLKNKYKSYWTQWPKAIRNRDDKTIANLKNELAQGIKKEKIIQYLFFSQDRKSTRLNSSHVKISYAVFCLKK